MARNCLFMPKKRTHSDSSLGILFSLWIFLVIFISVSPAMAGIGSQSSVSIAVDTMDPQLAVDQMDPHATFFTDDTFTFHWTSFDHNPGTSAENYQASIYIDSLAVETISWYPDITEFSWDFTMPEVQTANCYLEVMTADTFGNTTTQSSGNFTILLNTSGVPEAPQSLSLGAPSPNPFNPATTVMFSAPAGSQISLSVYDTRGRMVRNLMAGNSKSGTVSARWDGLDNGGRAQPGGVYVFVLDAVTAEGSQRLTRKAMLVP